MPFFNFNIVTSFNSRYKLQHTVEPRDWKNWFVTSGVRYIEVLFHT